VPETLYIIACTVFGLIIGSFLNVVIWRLPRGENLSHPGSHCPRCDHAIRPYDNVPVMSWLILRGKCRDCGSPISVRYPLVEAFTGAAFALTGWLVGYSILLLPMLWFVAVCIALAMIDIDVKRLPNSLVLTSWGVVAVGLTVTAAVQDSWSHLAGAGLGALAMGAGYLLLAVIYPAGMGMGDVKLAVLLGMVLGWFGMAQVVVGFFAGFLLGAIWGLVLIATRHGGRKTALPFGPFMIAGCWAALVWGSVIVNWYSGFLAIG
jgi:leader peptidase (prepilin peptidase) / N-methyltransferase